MYVPVSMLPKYCTFQVNSLNAESFLSGCHCCGAWNAIVRQRLLYPPTSTNSNMIANDRFTKNEISATISTNTNRYGNAITKNVIYEKRSGEMYALQHEMRNKATRKKQQA